MKTALIILCVGLLIWAALAVWVRSIAPDAARFTPPDTMPEVGTHTQMDGSTTVLAPQDPQAAFDLLTQTVAATPRTTQVASSPDHRAYVTRTRIMGFPDVTNVWLQGDRLAISGSLTLGKSDLGKNEQRIAGWLQQAGLQQP